MITKQSTGIILAAIMLAGTMATSVDAQPAQPPTLSESGQKLEAGYAAQIQTLKAEIENALPQIDASKKAVFLDAIKDRKSAAAQDNLIKAVAELNLVPALSDSKLDPKLVKLVVLQTAKPSGLAEFAQQGAEQAALVDKLLADSELMKQMLVADGAKEHNYGRAMEIYSSLQKASGKAKEGILQRLALAIALEHAVPVKQNNPVDQPNSPATVDPVERYRAYEKAYLDGELDPAFKNLTVWDLRTVVDGDEPDEVSAWGRQMLRNYRPDIVANPDFNWRYVQSVTTDVKYGSGDVKFDRPELQSYQNILMNGGICGRRAFFGRFILRAFGVPTTARPQTGHGSLVHWTPNGWVPCLGAGWGGGWTATRYKNDLDFLSTTQARESTDSFLQVKRAQWIGDVVGETPVYGVHDGNPGFWYGVSLCTQRNIIAQAKVKALAAVGTNLGESNESGAKPVIQAVATAPSDRIITVGPNGAITIPAAAYSKPSGSTADVMALKSFESGMQISLPRFGREGLTILRGGAWRGDANGSKSGTRLLSGGYGKYNNWGFRVAVTPAGDNPTANLNLDLGGGVIMEFVYIKPGTFTMGGESTTDGRFNCVELPAHEVKLTKGFYLGKYEVTQLQFQTIMGSNPSGASKLPDCPVDNIAESDATSFCEKLVELTGQDVRLPTEAEWEYACRAGSTTAWHFGDDPSQLDDYAWFKGNDGGMSHPVGQKKPNAWGLYDMHGNVCERVADIYARDYYAKSPKVDPTGPNQGIKSRFEYVITVPRSGTYALTARVVANNYNQHLNVSANDDGPEVRVTLPFTSGQWMDSEPVKLTLKEGANSLRFFRNDPPQAGIAVKAFTLTPVK